MANHADCGRIERAPNQIMPPDPALAFGIVDAFDDSNNNPNYWPVPWGHQYYGESMNFAKDMSGTSTNPTSLTSVVYETTVNSIGAIPPDFVGITAHTPGSDKTT